jgi:predicted Zn-dependent protease
MRLPKSLLPEDGYAIDAVQGTRHTRDQQVTCESRADEIGYKLIRKAGYSPYAAAGSFGRLEMYSGDTRTGIAGWFQQMSTDHPITPARVEKMRALLIQEVQANSILPR